jgi:transposase
MQVVAFRETGMEEIPMARCFGITQGTVSKILKRQRETGLFTPRPGRGRKLDLSTREDRQLVRLSLGGRTLSTNTFRVEWQRSLRFHVSRSLVSTKSMKAGLYAGRPRKKPLLRLQHRQQRLRWARGSQRVHVLHWQHVILSDGAQFGVCRRVGRIRV